MILNILLYKKHFIIQETFYYTRNILLYIFLYNKMYNDKKHVIIQEDVYCHYTSSCITETNISLRITCISYYINIFIYH